MDDKRLVYLYYFYGRIAYGKVYYNLKNKNIDFNYENMKKELEMQFTNDNSLNNKQLVKSK